MPFLPRTIFLNCNKAKIYMVCYKRGAGLSNYSLFYFYEGITSRHYLLSNRAHLAEASISQSVVWYSVVTERGHVIEGVV